MTEEKKVKYKLTWRYELASDDGSPPDVVQSTMLLDEWGDGQEIGRLLGGVVKGVSVIGLGNGVIAQDVLASAIAEVLQEYDATAESEFDPDVHDPDIEWTNLYIAALRCIR